MFRGQFQIQKNPDDNGKSKTYAVLNISVSCLNLESQHFHPRSTVCVQLFFRPKRLAISLDMFRCKETSVTSVLLFPKSYLLISLLESQTILRRTPSLRCLFRKHQCKIKSKVIASHVLVIFSSKKVASFSEFREQERPRLANEAPITPLYLLVFPGTCAPRANAHFKPP
jgi:hypothetical protein